MPLKSRRVAVMGFRSVGKSSLTIQFIENQFVDAYNPTIENTFRKKLKVRGQEYDINVVDTAGQDEFSIVPQSYTMNIDGYVLVYSVASDRSFQVVQAIHDKLLDTTGQQNVPLVLVGNKTDLRMDRYMAVTPEMGKNLADSWKAAFVESSARENQRVADVFTAIINEIEKAEGNYVKEEGGGCKVM